MKNEFKEIMNRQGNGSLKWDWEYIEQRFKVNTPPIYPLFIADMDFKMNTTIQKAMDNYIENPDFGYFHPQAAYYEAIINWHKQNNDLPLLKEWIIPSVGTVSAVTLFCYLYAKEENCLACTPIYSHLIECQKFAKVHLCPLILNKDKYDLDFKKLEQMIIANKIKILLFCNPHNPSGRCWSKEELLRLVLLCKKYQVLIVADEIHSDLNLKDKKFISLIHFHEVYNQIIVSTSANKTFNISGLCTSYVICANQIIREKFSAWQNELHLSPNRFGLKMQEIVYRYGQPWKLQLVAQIKSNINLVQEILKDCPLQIMQPDFGYLLWVKLDKIQDVDQYVADLAFKTHVLVETGSRFIDQYQGWIRLNVATSPSLLKEAIELFKQHLINYKGE